LIRRYQKSLFIFRRDLRIYDNHALSEALRLSYKILPCFIFDPAQIQPHPYQSKSALHFMLQSLVDLQQQLTAVGWRTGFLSSATRASHDSAAPTNYPRH